MKKLALILTLCAALGAGVAAQGGPFSGNAQVYLQLTPATPAINSTFEVDVFVDLTGITGSGSTARRRWADSPFPSPSTMPG